MMKKWASAKDIDLLRNLRAVQNISCFFELKHSSYTMNDYQLKQRQSKVEVEPFVVSLSNHDRLNRPPFDKALLSTDEGLRANG